MEKYKKISIAQPNIGSLEKKYVNDVMDSGWISALGPMVSRFEKEFAKYIGTEYAIAVSNGTTALDLALICLGIGQGDEVIVPTLTFAATVNAVIHQNAKPVFIDSSTDDWNLDPDKLEKLITKKTKAIIVVHLYGVPAKMSKILKIAKRHKLMVIEDAAEAHGAKYGKKMVGTLGHISCFSFFANKIITTGEGGMCATNNKKLYEKMKLVYSQGSIKAHGLIHYFHPVIGYNFRMTSLQAALGCAQLSRIKSFLKTRAQHEKIYRDLLKGVPGVSFSPTPRGTNPVGWMHSIIINHPRISRDDVMLELRSKGIETRPFFYPIHRMPPYVKYSKKSFPVADYLSERGINLPSAVNLKKSDIARIVKIIRDFLLE